MALDLNHPIISMMVGRPAKFASDNDMADALAFIYLGDATAGLSAANTLATSFVRNYGGSFTFIHNARRDVERTGYVPSAKLKGVLNVIRAEAIAQRDGKQFTAGRFAKTGPVRMAPIDSGFSFDHVPAGEYFVPHNGDTVVVCLEKPGPASKWSGHIFLSGGTDLPTFRSTHKLSRPKLGSQKPSGSLKFYAEVGDSLVRSLVIWAGATATSFPDDASGGGYPIPAKPAKPNPATSPAKAKKPVTPPVAAPAPAPAPAEPEVVSVRDLVRKRHGL